MMGRLIWIDNSWAVLPDGDPGTSFESSILFEALADKIDCEDLDPDGDGQIPLTGGKLVKGNGDQDDNRSEPWRIVYRPGVLISRVYFSAPAKMRDHGVVKSYLDFGHLKVFPDAPISLIIADKYNYDGQKAAALYSCGGLFICHARQGIGEFRKIGALI